MTIQLTPHITKALSRALADRAAHNEMAAGPIHLWTVYDNPADIPGMFVARRFKVASYGQIPTQDAIASTDLASLRDLLRNALFTLIPRSPGDEPHIVEVWIE